MPGFLRRLNLFWAVLTILLCSGLFYALNLRFFFFEKAPKWPLTVEGYLIRAATDAPSRTPLPSLPDISGYTVEGVLAKIPPLQAGRVHVSAMTEGMGFGKFTENANLPTFVNFQGRPEPVGIHIASGVYDLESLRAAINDPKVLSHEGDVWTLSLPVDISAGAALIIAGSAERRAVFHMAGDMGAFIANSGLLIIADTEVTGWDSKKNVPLTYDGDANRFRPFLSLWSGSQSYFARSSFSDIGYHSSKAYGISFSTDKAMMKADPSIPPPKGWVVECRFEGMYYGFYSYEAQDVAIIRNVYANNIIYGIDPHDRSRRLIIAENEAFGTHKKHGIIVSREVDDSWIFNNYSHNNHGSGFMLDRTSVRNVVANNLSYRNEADGMTLFESQDNVVYGNRLIGNGKNGLRIRNSWNVDARDNIILLNGGNGAQIYTQNLRDYEEKRDFELDPFTIRASMDLSGGIIAFNKTGGLKTAGTEYLRLSGLEFVTFTQTLIRGDLNDAAREIVKGMIMDPAGVEIRMKDGWSPVRGGGAPDPDMEDPDSSDSE